MHAPRYRYAFGPFVLDPEERLLHRHGTPVELPPRAFDVLVLLAAQPGHLLTKDALLESAWSGVVVEENALAVAVSRLRAALGEDGRGLIDTVAGRGYRFAGAVSVLTDDDGTLRAQPRAERINPDVADLVATVGLGGDGVAVSARRPRARALRRPQNWLIVGTAALVAAIVLAAVATRPRLDESAAGALVTAEAPPPEALLAYRRGRSLWESRRGQDMAEALYQFRLASAIDSTFAAAYVGEAQVYATSRSTASAAESLLRRALRLDSTLAEAWATLGFVRAFQSWDWAGAELAFARARGLSPEDVTTLQWLASLRMVQDRPHEAEALLRRALALAPDRANLHADLCEAQYYRRDYARAIATCERALALDPDHPFAWQHLFWAEAARTGRRSTPRLRTAYGAWFEHHAGLGRPDVEPPPDDVSVMMRTLRDSFFAGGDSSSVTQARLAARLGDQDAALAVMQRLVDERAFLAPFLARDPVFDALRSDPRWVAIEERIGSRQSQARAG